MTDHQTQTVERNTGAKWFNSPVTFHEGKLTEIRTHIPVFERRCFALLQPGNRRSRLNERLDTIVRLPLGDDKAFIPVGVVSKGYTLVQHRDIFDMAVNALNKEGIASEKVKAELQITEYGERMALSLYLPDEFSFTPADSHPMTLRIECFNSVDGSTRFRALMGWFRFVCSNGLVVGVTSSDIRLRHTGNLFLANDDDLFSSGLVGAVLASGLKAAKAEKKNFENWIQTEITMSQLAPWVDKELQKGWGFKAAARAYHIAKFGSDGEIDGQYRDSTPSTIYMKKTERVPGTPDQCHNLFDLSQILAWLAKERRDVQEQLEWREKIPELMKPLTPKDSN